MTSISGTHIIKAPCCGAELGTPAYSSINFMASEYWTDGYDHESLAPSDQGLRRCVCGRCFLLQSSKHISTIFPPKRRAPVGWETRKNNWWNRFRFGNETREHILKYCDTRPHAEIDAEQLLIPPDAKHVKDEELQILINANISDDALLEVVRRRYWRYLNHPAREVYRAFREAHKGEVDSAGHSATFPEFQPSTEQIENMGQLVNLLETAVSPNWLELAELHRELGNMHAAARALANIPVTEEVENLHYVVEKLTSLRVRGPVKFH
jgi:hypothetical protein